jgi:peptidoglycan-associated lipoprotein
MNRFIGCAAAALLAAGCASEEKKAQAPVESRAPQQAAASPTSSTTTPTRSDSIAANPLKDPNNVLSKRSVYFDFDTNTVKDEYQPLIRAHAKYLEDHGNAHIRIEGNCDERGSREYNLALGQRRAAAVKKIMTVLGVPDNRIETISYGEEKPAALGHDESSWAKNRRDDIKYAGE